MLDTDLSSIQPVCHHQTRHPVEFSAIMRDQCRIYCAAMRGNQQIIPTDAMSLAFQSRADFCVIPIGIGIQRALRE